MNEVEYIQMHVCKHLSSLKRWLYMKVCKHLSSLKRWLYMQAMVLYKNTQWVTRKFTRLYNIYQKTERHTFKYVYVVRLSRRKFHIPLGKSTPVLVGTWLTYLCWWSFDYIVIVSCVYCTIDLFRVRTYSAICYVLLRLQVRHLLFWCRVTLEYI